jgi:nucleotide-binding universal stress UspA family protein
MYRRILLAYDGSLEGRAALREGALLAKQSRAQVFLLSVIAESSGMRIAEATHAGPIAHQMETYKDVLADGAERLGKLGFAHVVSKLVQGEPAQEIGAFAKEMKADLIVVGHRRRGVIERWWSGSSGAYLSDHAPCSVLISRNTIPDAAFEAELQALAAQAPS